jgi:hypothetical protein
MKNRALLILFLLVLATPFVSAQGGPPPHTGKGPRVAALGDDLVALDYFLTMSDAELDRLLAAITRVRAMSSEERAAFRQKMIEYRSLPEEQRSVIRQGWGWTDQADRDDWRTMMLGKSEAERSAIQKELQSLAPEARTDRRLEMLREWRKTRPTEAP